MKAEIIYQVTFPDGEVEYLSNPSVGFEDCKVIKFYANNNEFIFPERNPNLNFFMSAAINGFNEGWNACLDEFKRLNKE